MVAVRESSIRKARCVPPRYGSRKAVDGLRAVWSKRRIVAPESSQPRWVVRMGIPMQERISPARRIAGTIRLPGDKSISHRYAMLAAIAEGPSRIRNYATGADCQSTLGAVQALGAEVERRDGEIVIHGCGLEGLAAPLRDLDAGNSGSTIRMLSGILAAQKFSCRIFGDESLSRRPMQRILLPLADMGAQIQARDGKFPPLS